MKLVVFGATGSTGRRLVEQALAGADAAVSALGARSYRAATTICSAGAESILEAMRASGVRRFVAISAARVATDEDPADRAVYRLAVRPLLWMVFKGAYEDMALMEREVRRSGVDWKIFRPPRLTDKPFTGRYRTALNHNVPGGYVISRADLADAILRRLNDPDAVEATVGIGY